MPTTECDAEKVWNISLKKYLGTDDEVICQEVENKARVIGYTRLLRRTVRRPDEEGAAEKIAYYKQQLIDVIGKVDSLTF